MNTYVISDDSVAAAAGAWLKWSAAPVLVAYRLGRIQGTKAAGQ